MSNLKLKFEDFQGEKLSKKQQKRVQAGEIILPPPPPPIDPGKGGLGGVN
ncbi:rSAM-modified peptide [Flavobacterium plurextorum]